MRGACKGLGKQGTMILIGTGVVLSHLTVGEDQR